jgi:hypothetical protein
MTEQMSEHATRFQRWVADLPSTNFRILVSICLAVVVVLSALLSMLVAPGRMGMVQEPIFNSILIFLGVMMGLDVTAFAIKRTTFTETPPASRDIEDAKASPPPAPPTTLPEDSHA